MLDLIPITKKIKAEETEKDKIIEKLKERINKLQYCDTKLIKNAVKKERTRIKEDIKTLFALLIYDFDKEKDIRKIEKREKELLKSINSQQTKQDIDKSKSEIRSLTTSDNLDKAADRILNGRK